MRYRIFRNNRLCGPFEPAELLRSPGFSAETLVCPESCSGTNMTDWQRAGLVAELSKALNQAADSGAKAEEAAGKSGPSSELEARMRSLEDRLASVSLLEEKLDKAAAAERGLEASVHQQNLVIEGLRGEVEALRERAAQKESEPPGAQGRSVGESGFSPELAAKIEVLEDRLASFQELKETLDEAVAAERGLEAVVKRQNLAMEELQRELAASRESAAQKQAAPPSSRPGVHVEPPPPAPAALPSIAEIPEAPRLFVRPAVEAGGGHRPENKTILIVDDDESVLNLLEIFVRRDGFAIELARTGEEALAKLQNKPDAMILDLMLPGASSGFDVLKQLRARSEPVLPVIVITAYGNSKEVEEVKKHPDVALFLPKPLNQSKLLGGLHKILGTQPPASPRKLASSDSAAPAA